MLDSFEKGIVGIYKISISNHVYIGQSIDIKSRITQHVYELRRKQHSNTFLQNVYNKHTESKLKIDIIYKANPKLDKTQLRKVLTILEQIFINYYNAKLNLQPAYCSNMLGPFNSGITVFNSTLYHPLKGTINIKNLAKYCKDNNIDSHLIKKVLNGTLDQYKGYFYNEMLYKVYVERSKDIYIEEGLEIPLPTSDIKLINELTKEIIGLENYYTEDTKSWSNQEWVNDIFLSLLETKCKGVNITEYVSQTHELLKSYSIQGGRVIKEEQKEHTFHDVIYINLQSAYGSSLIRFDYPIGIPTVVSFSNHTEKRISLKSFLKKYRNELVDGLYVIYVSGFLNHKQDIVFSKYELTSNNVGGKILQSHYEDNEGYEGRVGGQFLLTSKQIELGIITSEVLDVIEKVSSNKELKDWMNLNVDLVVYYPKDKELPLAEWVDKHNHSTKIGELTPQSDNRSRYWCRFSLDKFIGKLLETRLSYKSKRHESPIYECKQTLLKLFINTLYGDLASPFFPIGNSVVANNITASVRVGSWIMSKALSCKFIVTDGGLYTPLNIPTFKTQYKSFRKPGLETLYSKDSNWEKFIEYKSLFDITTSKELQDLLSQENIQDYIDTKALEHIYKFCEIYNINFPFRIEHKLDHSGYLAVSNPYGKVDYIIYTYKGSEVIRIRGIQPKDCDIHPKVELLRAIAENREITFHGCLLSEVIGINDYIRNPSRYGRDLPGYELEMEYIHKPNKTGGCIFENYLDFSRAESAHKKRVSRYESKYKDIAITLKPKFLST